MIAIILLTSYLKLVAEALVHPASRLVLPDELIAGAAAIDRQHERYPAYHHALLVHEENLARDEHVEGVVKWTDQHQQPTTVSVIQTPKQAVLTRTSKKEVEQHSK